MSFTEDWFSGNVPSIEATLLQTTAQHEKVNVLEIGCFEGRSTCWLDAFFKRTHCPCRITSIDTFEGGEEHFAKDGTPIVALDALEDRFRSNTKHIADLTVLKGFSRDMLFTLQPETFDVAYVDGSHHAADALGDLVMAFFLLRKGGTMIIDDVGGGSQSNELTVANIRTTPRLAVLPFLDLFQERLRVVHSGYQVHLIKTT